ncbi:MAG: superoxide dismutase [Ni] [Candidatus Omnitrophica bacterium]|nr:superoxide dismutase [Ni] [Candidatus Omnitrophota bacterium]MDD5488583.1 superoxide dismutase [Ni] [Candidatus Omnitrophota bacterium]
MGRICSFVAAALVFLAAMIPVAGTVQAHCQVPCGIYDDHMRIDMMLEDLKTVRKCIEMINKLSAALPVDYNQIVRWVNNKDVHADKISDVIAYYFMAQRLKPETDSESYTVKLELLHRAMYYAMKTKQGLDVANADELEKALKKFGEEYFNE